MRQKWGQNFLVDGAAADDIVAALAPRADDRVIEVGPGKGVLTERLVGRVADLTAVELDRVLASRLSERWKSEPRFRCVAADFLEWPLPEGGGFKVIGNLPYSSANAILRKVLGWPGWTWMVAMVQKEVAERIVAGPGGRDYGVLSLAVQGKSEVERLFDVEPTSFRPAPEVVSTVLGFTRRAVPLMRDEERFFRVVKAAFSQRRKTVSNTLSGGLALTKEQVGRTLEGLGIDPRRRAETLGLDDYNRLAEELPF
jgi:16S rRNA (adenine1518-N6/adenine1519-N6)-dimethyltransferase